MEIKTQIKLTENFTFSPGQEQLTPWAGTAPPVTTHGTGSICGSNRTVPVSIGDSQGRARRLGLSNTLFFSLVLSFVRWCGCVILGEVGLESRHVLLPHFLWLTSLSWSGANGRCRWALGPMMSGPYFTLKTLWLFGTQSFGRSSLKLVTWAHTEGVSAPVGPGSSIRACDSERKPLWSC